jgi:hypothetical protein
MPRMSGSLCFEPYGGHLVPVRFEVPRLARMSEKAKRVGLDRLLSCRPARRYSSMGVETLGSLVELTSKGFAQPSGYGKGCYTETAALLQAADRLIDGEGNIDEEQLCKAVSRPFVADAPTGTSNGIESSGWVQFPTLRYTNSRLEALADSARNQALHGLHLGGRALTAMMGLGVNNVGGFVDTMKQGINANNMSNFGRTAFNELAEAIAALSSSIDPLGGCDWVAYAGSRGFKVLPPESLQNPREILEQFSNAAEQAVNAHLDGDKHFSRRMDIFKERLHCPVGTHLTLEDLGNRHSRTREKIRQDQVEISKYLYASLLEGCYSVPVTRSGGAISYEGLRFRFRPEVESTLQSAKKAILAAGRKVWPLSEWVRFLAEYWNADPKLVERNTIIISMLYGFSPEAQPADEEAPSFLLFSDDIPSELKQECKELLRDLRRSMQCCSGEMPTDEILAPMGVEPVLEALNLKPDELLALTQAFDQVHPGVWKIKPEFFTPKVGRLTCDLAYEILSENAAEMHNTRLLKMVKARRPDLLENDRLLTVRLFHDPRFKPVGKLGYWTLAEWNQETGTVRDVIAKVLSEAAAPMSTNDIVRAVRSRIPCSAKSVSVYLTQSPQMFVKLGVNIYGLASNYPNRLRHDDA